MVPYIYVYMFEPAVNFGGTVWLGCRFLQCTEHISSAVPIEKCGICSSRMQALLCSISLRKRKKEKEESTKTALVMSIIPSN